jgi:hypothetical protein
MGFFLHTSDGKQIDDIYKPQGKVNHKLQGIWYRFLTTLFQISIVFKNQPVSYVTVKLSCNNKVPFILFFLINGNEFFQSTIRVVISHVQTITKMEGFIIATNISTQRITPLQVHFVL